MPRSQTLGAPGSRQFVLGFYGVRQFNDQAVSTFEMILHEGSNNIEFQYGTLADVPEPSTIALSALGLAALLLRKRN